MVARKPGEEKWKGEMDNLKTLKFSYGALAWDVGTSNRFISFYRLVFITLKCVKLLFMVLYESSKVGHDSLEENSIFVAFFKQLSLHIILKSNAL